MYKVVRIILTATVVGKRKNIFGKEADFKAIDYIETDKDLLTDEGVESTKETLQKDMEEIIIRRLKKGYAYHSYTGDGKFYERITKVDNVVYEFKVIETNVNDYSVKELIEFATLKEIKEIYNGIELSEIIE